MGNASFKSRLHRGDTQHLLTESLIVTKEMDVRDVYDIVDVIGRGSISTIYKVCKKKAPSHKKIRHVLDDANLPKGISQEHYDGRGRSEDGSSQHTTCYALKEIDADKVDPQNRKTFFDAEIAALRSLDHPCIVRAFETFTYLSEDGSRNMTGIVMELCQGGDLNQRAPYNEQQAGKILYKLVEAVHYMHTRNVMHLDIKMENIMFESTEPDAEIKLIDFGLSAKFLRREKFELFVGTCYYMAPEVFMGDYDFLADMWSVGVVAFILLSGGEKPFVAKCLSELRQKILQADYNFDSPAWKSVSNGAKQFVTRLLEFDPSLRYTAEDALKNKWLSQFKPNVNGTVVKEVLSQLQDVSAKTEFEKLAWLVIARNSSAPDISRLREVFDELDQDHDGKISHVEFKKAMIGIMRCSAKEVEDIFHHVDVQRAGAVDYTTFLATWLAVQGHLEEGHIEEVFEHFDVDHCGYITSDHLKQVLGRNVSKRVITKLLEEVDEHNDGKVGLRQFKLALT